MSQTPNKANNIAEYELYKRIKLLGEGAFGKAFLVQCLEDQTYWVQKQLNLSCMSEEEKTETINEAKILKSFNHQNIVKFKEVYRTKKGKLSIIMEYADGGDLSKKIKEAKGKQISENQILDWFTQICLAIKHVHDRKIIHRDLKGQNIFLTKNNLVKLGDFGIAKILNKTADKAKTMVGTPYYLSPEIIENKPYTGKSDIWSLGVILYELCMLKPPFDADSLHFLALKIVRGQFSPISDIYSREIKNLVSIMLQVDPTRRPSIHEILKMPIITNRVSQLLSISGFKKEFSHTIFHNQKCVENHFKLDDCKLVNKEEPMPPHLLAKLQTPIQDQKLLAVDKPQQSKQISPSKNFDQPQQQKQTQQEKPSPQKQQNIQQKPNNNYNPLNYHYAQMNPKLEQKTNSDNKNDQQKQQEQEGQKQLLLQEPPKLQIKEYQQQKPPMPDQQKQKDQKNNEIQQFLIQQQQINNQIRKQHANQKQEGDGGGLFINPFEYDKKQKKNQKPKKFDRAPSADKRRNDQKNNNQELQFKKKAEEQQVKLEKLLKNKAEDQKKRLELEQKIQILKEKKEKEHEQRGKDLELQRKQMHEDIRKKRMQKPKDDFKVEFIGGVYQQDNSSQDNISEQTNDTQQKISPKKIIEELKVEEPEKEDQQIEKKNNNQGKPKWQIPGKKRDPKDIPVEIFESKKQNTLKLSDIMQDDDPSQQKQQQQDQQNVQQLGELKNNEQINEQQIYYQPPPLSVQREMNDKLQMLQEMAKMVEEASKQVEQISDNNANVFNSNTWQSNTDIANQVQDQDDQLERDDDENEPEPISHSQNDSDEKNKHQMQYSQEDYIGIGYINSDYNKLESLRVDLENAIGTNDFLKAYQILKKEVEEKDLNSLENEYRKDKFRKLLPFLNNKLINECTQLLLTLILMEDQMDKQQLI